MTLLPIAQTVLTLPEPDGSTETCSLDYDARFVRRKTLTTDTGTKFLLDLGQTTSLAQGDILPLSNGTQVIVTTHPVRSWQRHCLSATIP